MVHCWVSVHCSWVVHCCSWITLVVSVHCSSVVHWASCTHTSSVTVLHTCSGTYKTSFLFGIILIKQIIYDGQHGCLILLLEVNQAFCLTCLTKLVHSCSVVVAHCCSGTSTLTVTHSCSVVVVHSSLVSVLVSGTDTVTHSCDVSVVQADSVIVS